MTFWVVCMPFLMCWPTLAALTLQRLPLNALERCIWSLLHRFGRAADGRLVPLCNLPVEGLAFEPDYITLSAPTYHSRSPEGHLVPVTNGELSSGSADLLGAEW